MRFGVMRFDAVILDLDGTLLDTERAYRAAFGQALAAAGLWMSDAAYAGLIGIDSPRRIAWLAQYARAAGLRSFAGDGFLAAYRIRRERALHGGVRLRPGAAALLDALQRRDVPAAICTSASRETAERHIRRAGLAKRGLRLITRDDVRAGKPRPDGYLAAAAALGARPARCLAIEDSPHGVAAAHGAGMPVLMTPDLVAPDAACRRQAAGITRDLFAAARRLFG